MWDERKKQWVSLFYSNKGPEAGFMISKDPLASPGSWTFFD